MDVNIRRCSSVVAEAWPVIRAAHEGNGFVVWGEGCAGGALDSDDGNGPAWLCRNRDAVDAWATANMFADLGYEDGLAIRCPANANGAATKGCQPRRGSAIDWHDVRIIASETVAGKEDVFAIRADEWACIVGGVNR